jgi:RimJ/RimL family protein N-acetyltransferase
MRDVPRAREPADRNGDSMASEGQDNDSTAPRHVVRIRPARFSDVGSLVRMYRDQSAESRQMYHPFPFDRLRLTFIFLYMVTTRRLLGRLLKWAPRRALVLLVATVNDDPRPVGYGNVAFVRRPTGIKAIFGYLVLPAYRGHGVGTRLHEEMIEAAIALGIRRGGGMVIRQNAANLRVLDKLGFTMMNTGLVDRSAPGASNIETDGDLTEIAERFRQRRAGGGGVGSAAAA